MPLPRNVLKDGQEVPLDPKRLRRDPFGRPGHLYYPPTGDVFKASDDDRKALKLTEEQLDAVDISPAA